MAPGRAVEPGSSKTMIVHVLALLLALGLFLLATIAVQAFARQHIRSWDRYTTAFADMDCLPPTAQDRAEFLAEVQYLAGMPDHFQILDRDLAPRLADAFARHPRVERVERVTILPPKQIQVRLVYRKPNQRSEVRSQRSEVTDPRLRSDLGLLTSDL